MGSDLRAGEPSQLVAHWKSPDSKLPARQPQSSSTRNEATPQVPELPPPVRVPVARFVAGTQTDTARGD